ncbi:MAG: hypothetical protein OJF61_000358 [Rhodanobacteraceae bacterium]|jgi:hypothetical protein|nr:MAG: hypothetical protein OJF61_000358 [Rhodanobacteraceae bacterium]
MATKLQVPDGILDPIRKDVFEGKFTLSLPRCELRQCGTETPLTLSGAGFVDQGADGGLTLRMFVTEKYDVREGMNRLGFGALTSGVLIPTSAYYDISGRAQNFATWRAEHQSVDPSFGVGTEIRVSLSHMDKVDTLSKPAALKVKQWFIPGEFKLPWHVVTRTERSLSRDRFESGDDEFAWVIKKSDGGMDVQFTVKNGQELEPHATRFMQALEMLVGRSLRPLLTSTVSGNERLTRVHRRPMPERSSLVPPVELGHFEPGDAHRFLSCCLHRAERPPTMGDQLLLLYRFWWRILRSYQSDIENSSLVLSVAIEGVLQALFLSEHDADAEFCRLVGAAEPAIERLDIDERVRSSLFRSLDHSIAPKPQEAMRRLREQCVLADAHIKAWGELRHKGAHGAMLEDDLEKYQNHLDRYHCCLDLFYRILFTAVGYRGGSIDYSTRGWPPSTFPPGDEVKVASPPSAVAESKSA